MMQLRKAERRQAKMRVGVTAPSGGGKTYSALLLAYGLSGDWSKVAVIDTENGSADLYAHLGPYNVITLDAPFTPERYVDAITACEKAGMSVVVIDSATHEWDGPGGCLEIKDALGGKYQDWAKVTPRHQRFLNAILQSDCHIVTTTRRKQDYEMTKDGNRVAVEKVGLKEVQRDGFEYELTLNFELDIRHNAIASKDRTGLFADKPAFVITTDTGKVLREWCESGAAPLPASKPVEPMAPPKPISPEAMVETLAQSHDMNTVGGGCRVGSIDTKDYQGTPWWIITFSDGRSGSTFDAAVADAAAALQRENAEVRPILAPSKKDKSKFNVTGILKVTA